MSVSTVSKKTVKNSIYILPGCAKLFGRVVFFTYIIVIILEDIHVGVKRILGNSSSLKIHVVSIVEITKSLSENYNPLSVEGRNENLHALSTKTFTRVKFE
mgnify:CR=1 FL=1